MTTADWIALGALAAVLLAVYLWLRWRDRPAPVTVHARKQIALDGTNILFWRDERAQLVTLTMVVRRLQREGFDPVVFLDASSRHHLGDRSLNEERFAMALGLPANRVMVCPAKTEADAFILEYAGAQKLSVVSNDRFRDRPRERRNIPLVSGHFQGERLVLKGL